MQHYIVEHNIDKVFTNQSVYLERLSTEYTCTEYELGNYKVFIFENQNNKLYDIKQRAAIIDGNFYYEKGYSKRYDQDLEFNVANKVSLFNQPLENIDGNFLYLSIIDGKLNIRRNHMSMITSFYAQDQDKTFFSNNASLISTVIDDEINEEVFKLEMVSTFALWTVIDRNKKLKVHKPTTKLSFDGEQIVETNQQLFTTDKVTSKDVALRLKALLDQLISTIDSDYIKLDVTAGNDSRLAVALLTALDLDGVKVKVGSNGLPASIDRKIGKYIADKFDFPINPIPLATAGISKQDYKAPFESRANAYNLITYGGANNYKRIEKTKIQNALYLTGHFGNVVSLNHDKLGFQALMNGIAPKHELLSQTAKAGLTSAIEQVTTEEFGKTTDFTNEEYIRFFLKYQKHNYINNIINENEFMMFSPFANDVFLNAYHQSSVQEKCTNKLHRDVGEYLSYELYNELPFETIKGYECINNTKFLPIDNALYFDAPLHEMQQAYYNSNRQLILDYILRNSDCLIKDLDLDKIKQLMSADLDRPSFFVVKNIVGNLIVDRKRDFDDQFFYPSLEKKVDSPTILEERFTQNKFKQEMKFLNLKDTYFNKEIIVFDYKVIDPSGELVAELKRCKQQVEGVRVSKHYYRFEFSNLAVNGLDDLIIYQNKNQIDTRKVYIKSMDKVVIDDLEFTVRDNQLKIYNLSKAPIEVTNVEGDKVLVQVTEPLVFVNFKQKMIIGIPANGYKIEVTKDKKNNISAKII